MSALRTSVLAAAGVAILLGIGASARAQQSQTGIRPVATVKQLHELIITPASDAVFRAGGDELTTEKAWLDARDQAIVLSEGGNLLMLGSRARDGSGWLKLSRALVDAAAAAANAAEKRNTSGLADAGDAITAACEACHAPYRDRGRGMQGSGR